MGVLIIIIIFKRYCRRRHSVSTLSDGGRPSVAARHVSQRVFEISDHPPPFNRGSWRPPRISYASRGRADRVFGTASLAGGTSLPVTRTPATALCNSPRSICASFYLPSSYRHCFFDRQIRCTMDQYPIHIIR